MPLLIETREKLQTYFKEMVATKRAVLPLHMAEQSASQQIFRDIQAGEIERTAGIEFLIEQELKYGHTREHALLVFNGLFDGKMMDWPSRDMGSVN